MLRLALLLALLASPAQAQPLTDASVRTFLAGQERAWNAGQFDRYFSGFTPEATFTDQAYVGDKPPVRYGTSTLAQARAQALRGKVRSREVSKVTRLDLAPDRASARVTLRISSTLTAAGGTRILCASRLQTVVSRGGHTLSSGQTDTLYKCRR